MIFETLNDRGRDLTIADLLKNYLFGRAGGSLDAVRDAWVASVGALDAIEAEVFTTFLRHFWSSKYGATRERDLYQQIKQRITTEAEALSFSQELKVAGVHYAALLNASHGHWTTTGVASKVNIETLLVLKLEQSRPLLLAVMAKFTPAETTKALKAMVSWGVRGILVGGIGGGGPRRKPTAPRR